MKKRMITAAVAVTAAMLVAGCGAQNASTAQPSETVSTEVTSAETEAKEEPVSTEQASVEEETESEKVTSKYEDPSNLPVYTYQGDEEYLDVISGYMVTDYAKNYGDQGDVFIPYSVVVERDESNPEDILVYGIFDIDGYDLRNSTLVTCCGGRNYGIFHLKKADDGTVTVTDAELPMTEEETEELFAGVPDIYDKVRAVTDEELNETRATAIAEYVNSNGLNILQWQDYGRLPVAVLNAPETPEEDQFYTFESSHGYGITYDLREFTLEPSDESDMYGKVEDDFTGTLMVIKKVPSVDPATALQDASASAGVTDLNVTDASIGDDISCAKAEWEEKLDDGRSFLYVGYAVPSGDDSIVVLLESTYEKGTNEITLDGVDELFASTISTFHVD